MFISIKKWFQTNYLGAAAQLAVEGVENTRSAAPNPPCCEILVSKDCSILAERKYRQSGEIQVDIFCVYFHQEMASNELFRCCCSVGVEFWCTCSFLYPIPTQASPKEWPPLYQGNEWVKWTPKGSTMVCTCLLSTKSTNFWDALLHNIIEVINFIFKVSLLFLLNNQWRTSQLTFINLEHSNLTWNDKNKSTWPHLKKTESLTLALIQHHGFFEKQCTCLEEDYR